MDIPIRLKNLIESGQFSVIITANMRNAIVEYCRYNKRTDLHSEYMLAMTGIFYEKYLQMDKIKYRNEGIGISSIYLKKIFGGRNYSLVKKDCLKCTLNFFKPYNYMKHTLNRYKVKIDSLEGIQKKYLPNVETHFLNNVKEIMIGQYQLAYKADKIWGDNRVRNGNEFIFEIWEYYKGKSSKKLLNILYHKGILSNSSHLSREQLKIRNENLLEDFIHGGDHFTKKPDATGRIYNIFSLLKREFRGLLSEDYIEVDFSCHHPFLLGEILNYLLNTDTRKLNQESNFIGKLKQQFINILEFDQEEITKLGLTEFYDWNIKNLSNVELLDQLMDWDWMGKVVTNPEMETSKYKIILSLVLISYLKKRNIYLINNLLYSYSGTTPSESLSSDLKKWLIHSQNGHFYDFITDFHRDDSLLFCKKGRFLSDKNKPISIKLLTPSLMRDIVKRSYMIFQNKKPSKKIDESDFFNLIFPTINSLILHLKQTFGYTSIHSLVCCVESNIVFDIINQCYCKTAIRGTRPFLVGSIHDGLFVEKNKLKFLQEIIKTRCKKYFNQIPAVKVKDLKAEYLKEIDINEICWQDYFKTQ